MRSAPGPGCVKTSTRGECAELFSLFSSFDGACQNGSFLIQRNRDKRSTRKFGVGVFTQPRSKGEILAKSKCLPLYHQHQTFVRNAASRLNLRCQVRFSSKQNPCRSCALNDCWRQRVPRPGETWARQASFRASRRKGRSMSEIGSSLCCRAQEKNAVYKMIASTG